MWHHLIRRVFATLHAGTRAPPLSSPPAAPLSLFPTICAIQTHQAVHQRLELTTTPVLWHQPRSPTPDDNEGATRIRDITNPQAQGAKQLAPTEEDLSHVSRDSNHSGPNGYSGRGEARERERQTLLGLLRSWSTLKFRSSPPSFPLPSISPSRMAVNSCGYLSLSYIAPSGVAPAGQEWLTSDKEEIGVEHGVAKFDTRMNDKSKSAHRE